VRHKGRAITGFLEEHNLDYDIAVVKIMSFLDAQNVPLHSAPPILPNSKVVAVGHDSSGKIMATDGKLTCGPSVCKYGESLMSSTCILSKVRLDYSSSISFWFYETTFDRYDFKLVTVVPAKNLCKTSSW